MRLNNLPIAVMMIALSGSAAAQVTLDIPDTVEVLIANGETPKLEGGLFDAEKTLTLPDGENQILFRYKPYFHQGNERIIVESQPIIATFHASNSELTLDLPKYRNQRDAKRELPSATYKMLDSSNAPLELSYDRLIKEGMQIGRNYQQELEKYNQEGGLAAMTNAATGQHKTPFSTQSEASTAEEMLHFWYGKADAETKARFKQFVKEN